MTRKQPATPAAPGPASIFMHRGCGDTRPSMRVSMGARFRPYSSTQMLLFPPDSGEWLPEGHLAYHVSVIVDSLDLRAFFTRYEGDGRRKSPREPGMMVKILVYGCATGGVRRVGLPANWRRMLHFGSSQRGTTRSTGRSVSFVGDTWWILRRVFVDVVRGCRRDGACGLREAVRRRREGEHAQGEER